MRKAKTNTQLTIAQYIKEQNNGNKQQHNTKQYNKENLYKITKTLLKLLNTNDYYDYHTQAQNHESASHTHAHAERERGRKKTHTHTLKV